MSDCIAVRIEQGGVPVAQGLMALGAQAREPDVATGDLEIAVLSGHHDHRNVGILKFPDLNQAHGWYESEAYQCLISNRDAAADMTVVSYEEPGNNDMAIVEMK